MKLNKEQWLHVSLFVICTLICLWPSFYNRYPLLGNDSAAYLASGHNGHVPVDRPLYYGLLVRHISMSRTLWIPAVFQCLVLVLVLYRLYSFFIKKFAKLSFLLIFGVLCFATPLAITANYILPDIYTTFMLLSLVVYLFEPVKKLRIAWMVLFVFSIMTHYSHFVTAPAIAVFVLLFTLFGKLPELRKRTIQLVVACILQVPLSMGMNYVLDGSPKLSRSSNLFLLCKFMMDGHLDRLLAEHCDENNYPLCGQQNRLKNGIGFLWDAGSPVFDGPCSQLEFGPCFEEKNELYKPMVTDIVKYYPKEVLVSSLIGTWHQLNLFQAEDLLSKYNIEASQVTGRIAWHYDKELKVYKRCRQYHNTFNLPASLVWVHYLWYFTLLVAVFLFWKLKNPEERVLLLSIGAGLVSNAFFCATLSDVINRYQSRVIFVWVFVVFMLLVKYISNASTFTPKAKA